MVQQIEEVDRYHWRIEGGTKGALPPPPLPKIG